MDKLSSFVGLQYAKQKYFRKLAMWLSQYLSKYNPEELEELINNKSNIIDNIEVNIKNDFNSLNVIRKHKNDLRVIISALTPNDYEEVAKKVYFHTPKHRDFLIQHLQWLVQQLQQISIRLAYYIDRDKL